MEKLKSAAAGAAAGIINGLCGGGGGMVLVPLLTRWIKLEDRSALATSVAVMLPLSLVSAAVYIFRGGVDIMAALPYLAGGLVGGFVGGKVFKSVPPALLHKILGLFIIYGGVRNIVC